jgi:hypothetical protein
MTAAAAQCWRGQQTPGLRVGFGDSRHANEILLDSGLFLLDEAGFTLSLFSASASYQHAFASSRPLAPFTNVGMGLFREGGSMRASTSVSFGGGVGLRRIIRDRRGTIRAEMRADYLQRDPTFGRPPLTSIGLRLGFDLWL